MDFTSIHNYYEHLVTDYMISKVIPSHPDKSTDFFLDVACYALTKLPARYMRHEIDMAFYLDSNDRTQMARDVQQAVNQALDYIEKNFERE